MHTFSFFFPPSSSLDPLTLPDWCMCVCVCKGGGQICSEPEASFSFPLSDIQNICLTLTNKHLELTPPTENHTHPSDTHAHTRYSSAITHRYAHTHNHAQALNCTMLTLKAAQLRSHTLTRNRSNKKTRRKCTKR